MALESGQFVDLQNIGNYRGTLAHDGEARDSRRGFEALSDDEKDQIIEFLKSLQVVAP